MNKPDGQAYAIVGGVALTQLFFGLTLAIFPGWPKVGEWLNSGSAASWAQAFMAFIAILAGAGAIAWQVQRQAKMEAERHIAEQVRRLQALNYGVFLLRLKLVLLREEVHRGASHKRQMPDVLRAVDCLEKVSLMDFPSAQASHAIANCISAVAFMQDHLDLMGPLINDELLTGFRVEKIDEAYSFVSNCEASLAGELVSLGARSPDMYFEIGGRRYISGRAPD